MFIWFIMIMNSRGTASIPPPPHLNSRANSYKSEKGWVKNILVHDCALLWNLVVSLFVWGGVGLHRVVYAPFDLTPHWNKNLGSTTATYMFIRHTKLRNGFIFLIGPLCTSPGFIAIFICINFVQNVPFRSRPGLCSRLLPHSTKMGVKSLA